jgi:hypothetical protein
METKFALCATKKINFLTLVSSEKKFLNEAKNHNPPPPFKLNGRSLIALRNCLRGLGYGMVNANVDIKFSAHDPFLELTLIK